MSEKDLPVRPDLEQYKKQAKELLKAWKTGDADACDRMKRFHPQPPQQHAKLTEAQLVIAREHGFESWTRFAAEIEARRIAAAVEAIDDPASAFLIAASVPRGTWHAAGTLDEAAAILARYPQVANASVYTAAVLGGAAQLRAWLERDAALATATGGPHNWDALMYLCFSRYLRFDRARSEGFTAAAQMLLQGGANANGGWHEKPDHEGGAAVWESVLYGAAGIAQHPGVTKLLLEYGADPNDGETPYHVPESYDNTVLQILLESGKVDERGKAWIVARKADWHDEVGLEMALKHGATPNYVPHWGRSGFQHSIQRGNGMPLIRLLMDYGADPFLPNNIDGLTGAQMAARTGRGDILRLFAERGIDPQFTGADRLIAACATADRDLIHALVTEEPELRDELIQQGGEFIGRFAVVGNTEGVECLLDLAVPVDAPTDGDPYWGLEKQSTALHWAAWLGNSDTVKLLLKRGATVNARDVRERTPLHLAVTACVDSYWMRRRSPEWVRPLLEAGATLDGIELPCGYAEADELLMQYAQSAR